MQTGTQPEAGAKVMLWAGRILSALVVLSMVMSAVMKFVKPPEVTEGLSKLGLPEDLLLPIGITELACALIYAFPRTAPLGAILLTGYLGGAVFGHVRTYDPFISPIIVGVLAWLGLWLRDGRVRGLIPWSR